VPPRRTGEQSKEVTINSGKAISKPTAPTRGGGPPLKLMPHLSKEQIKVALEKNNGLAKLQPIPSLEGNVTFSSGRPDANETVVLCEGAQCDNHAATTNGNGHYAIFGLPQGKHTYCLGAIFDANGEDNNGELIRCFSVIIRKGQPAIRNFRIPKQSSE
jgi:hypothetical protein